MKEFVLMGWYNVPYKDKWGWEHIIVDATIEAETAKKAIKKYIKSLPETCGYHLAAVRK